MYPALPSSPSGLARKATVYPLQMNGLLREPSGPTAGVELPRGAGLLMAQSTFDGIQGRIPTTQRRSVLTFDSNTCGSDRSDRLRSPRPPRHVRCLKIQTARLLPPEIHPANLVNRSAWNTLHSHVQGSTFLRMIFELVPLSLNLPWHFLPCARVE